MLTLYLIYHPLERINLYHWYIYPLTESVTNLLNHSANFHPHLKLLATDYKTLREREREILLHGGTIQFLTFFL